jgi:hypothetical protein
VGKGGRPGLGCFMTNTMVDGSQRSREASDLVLRHCARMVRGFENALLGETNRRTSTPLIRNLAVMLATFAQGFFAVSRMPDKPEQLTDLTDLADLQVAHRTVISAVRAQLSSTAVGKTSQQEG